MYNMLSNKIKSVLMFILSVLRASDSSWIIFENKWLDKLWTRLTFGEFTAFLAEKINPWQVISKATNFASKNFSFRATVLRFLFDPVNKRMARSLAHIFNRINFHHAEVYESTFRPNGHYRWLLLWADWDASLTSLVTPTLHEAWASSKTWRRLGWSKCVSITVTSCQIDDDVDSSGTLLFKHIMMTLAALRYLMSFLILYQTWPWRSCLFEGTSLQEADTRRYAEAVFKVVRILQQSTNPGVQRQTFGVY